jgi:hypothetical protein
VSVLCLLTAIFPKKTSHFLVQTFSFIHIHSYNVHVQNWRHFVFFLLYLTISLHSLYLFLIRLI